MKIIIITDHIKGDSGWSRYSHDLAFGLRERGHEILCVVQILTPESDLKQKQCFDNPLKYVSNPIQAFLSAVRVNKIIKEFNPDIVQFTVEPYSTMIPFLLKRSYKIVLNAHSTFAYLPILVKGVKRRFLEFYSHLIYVKTDSIFCLSRYTREHLIKHMSSVGLQNDIEGKLELVGGALNVQAFPVLLSEKHNDPKIIMMVGAIKSRKGVLESINSLAFVKTDFIYNIVGIFDEDSGYVQILRKRIKELGFEKKVLLLGRLSHEELQALYKKADLYLMLSTNNGVDFEGYGLVYLEANNYGLPCIGPKDSGVADAIIDGITGYLVDQNKPEEVAKRIDDVLTYNKINSIDCIGWAKKNSVQEQSKKVEEIYKKLLT